MSATTSRHAQRPIHSSSASSFEAGAGTMERPETALESVQRRLGEGNSALVNIRDRLLAVLQVAEGPMPLDGKETVEPAQNGRIPLLRAELNSHETLVAEISEAINRLESIM